MKSTLRNKEPLVTISETPFHGPAFEDYVWFRTNVLLPIHDNVTEVQAEVLQEVTDHES